ncbi:hypothetical protein INT45_007854 [Circinella minor]|uniref:PARP-type domain-containing protein n=1 Tax=Circinella minor TaxID=1195481 RepID=A0A8H7VCK0_9FUNG|nr:hypothetical protein INT45_007854 [Circinella minor]
MSEKEGITTYCIEYAIYGKAECASCNKVIQRHSLRAAEIFRKSKSEKKKSAKHSWYHITCWKVPELVTKLPIEQFRGYRSLKEKDKKRIQQVIEKGVGATWNDVIEKPLPSKEDNELLKQVADDDNNNNKNDNDKKDDKKNKKKDEKKKRKRNDEQDMTAQLTGVTQPLYKKKKNNDNKEKNEQESLSKKKKNNKKDEEQKSKQIEEIKLDKQDQIELENLAKQIQAVTKNL